MFDARWLLWFLTYMRQWLAGAVSAEITARVAAQPSDAASEGVAVTVAGTRAVVYEYVRMGMYMAWFAQILFMRMQAIEHGEKLRYTPSMPGVSPQLVDNILREELRITGGRVTAPLDEVLDRVNARLGSLIPATARRTAVYAVEDDKDTRDKSLVYALEHGSPVGRFLQSVYDENSNSPLRNIYLEDKNVSQVLDKTLEDWQTAYDKVKPGTLEITGDMIADWRELRPNLSKDEIDVFAHAWKQAAIAEIELAEDMPERIYPNTWYYEWVKNQRTGSVDYIAPPNNAVFKWLKYSGELGQHTELKYMTAQQYRQRAIDIVNSLPPEWHMVKTLRWARIPTGDYTCAFCLMLAARGPVYHSSASSQLNGFDHDWCDCLVVPVYDEEDYPFMQVVQAARKLYDENKKLFAPQYSRNLYESTISRGKNKGKKVMRHKTYIHIPRETLLELAKDMPRVKNDAYRAWEKKMLATLVS